MDVWESNSMAAAVTPHSCSVNGQYRCSGTQCGDGSNRYGGLYTTPIVFLYANRCAQEFVIRMVATSTLTVWVYTIS
jgi:hypothetical protein